MWLLLLCIHALLIHRTNYKMARYDTVTHEDVFDLSRCHSIFIDKDRWSGIIQKLILLIDKNFKEIDGILETRIKSALLSQRFFPVRLYLTQLQSSIYEA